MKDSPSSGLSRRGAISLIGIGTGLGLATVLGGETGLAAALEQAASKVTFPKDAIIRTVLKDISPEALGSGTTLFHDHLSMSSPRPYAKPTAIPPQPQWSENVDAVIEEVKAAARDGVRCIVSGGTRDLGQKPESVRRIAERVAGDSMHIVLSDALWIQASYPPDIAGKTEDQIAEDFVRDSSPSAPHRCVPLARGEEQARMLLSLLEAGYEDHVLLSSDAISDAERKHNGGPGYAMSQTVFVPRLRAAGVTEATLHKIQVDNPRRFLAFVPRTA